MRDVIAGLAARAAGLQLLVLHGSRARGDSRATSDWDLAYLADGRFDPDVFLADLVLGLRTDRVDLSRLSGASGLFRYRVARDGEPLFEDEDGAFTRFWFEAVSFWCDAEPLLRSDPAGVCLMGGLDRQILAEKAAAIERHLAESHSGCPRNRPISSRAPTPPMPSCCTSGRRCNW